jgi:DNA modification methylase
VLIRADAGRLPLADNSVQTVVTSPPYLRQRVYGDSDLEGGREETLEAYVQWLAGVFDELRRVLHPSGHAWLNIGDKANGSGGAGGDWSRARPDSDLAARQQRDRGPGKFLDPLYEEATYLDVPGAVVAELIRRGWRLRMPIVWDKLREAPESLAHVKRPRFRHEMIYLLSPAPRPARKKERPPARFYPSQLEETGSIWHFRPGGSGPAHLAPFPDELARRCILPTTLPGDVVFDPFDGSGTTRRVAAELGRVGIGTDLYAGVDVTPEAIRRRTLEKSSRLVSKPGTVDLKDLSRVGLKPATLYYVSRELTKGRTLEDLAREQKMTSEQVAYVEELLEAEPRAEVEG